MPAQTSVLIVNFNANPKLKRMLESLKMSEALTSEVIVVDNASFDDSAEMVRQNFPAVRVAKLERNVGFYAAARAGMKLVKGDVVVVCHSDLITTLHALLELADQLREASGRRAAAMIPRLVNADGDRAPNVGRLPTLNAGMVGMLKPNLARRLYVPALDHIADHEYATLTCAAFDVDMIQTIGGFDAGYFVGFGDADLAVRMHDKSMRLLVSKDVTVVHTGSRQKATDANVTRLLRKDLGRYFEKRRASWEQSLLRGINGSRKLLTRSSD